MEIGYGNGTSIPTGIDTGQNYVNVSNPRPDSSSRIDAELANDLVAAVLAMETDLYRIRFVDARTYTTFTQAIAAAANKTLLICSSVTLDANTIIGTTTSIFPVNPGVINANGKTLTINGPVVGSPMHQWLSGFAAGEVTFGDGVIEYFRPQWWGLSLSASATTNTLAMHCAAAAANAIGGGVVKVPSGGSFALSQFTFGSMSNVIIEGSSQGYNYGSAKSSSDFTVTTGVWGIRFPVTSAYCELRNINVSSNGSLSDTYPHTIITAGVEYGIL